MFIQAWMDQGGTFTDLVLLNDKGELKVRKLLTQRVEVEATQVRRGTTVATNALLERNGVKTVLVTNRGFGDIRYIGDQRRERLFDISASK